MLNIPWRNAASLQCLQPLVASRKDRDAKAEGTSQVLREGYPKQDGSLSRTAMHLQPFRFEPNVSSDWTTRGWCPRPGFHRHYARFECAVSALDYAGELVGMKGLAPQSLPDF